MVWNLATLGVQQRPTNHKRWIDPELHEEEALRPDAFHEVVLNDLRVKEAGRACIKVPGCVKRLYRTRSEELHVARPASAAKRPEAQQAINVQAPLVDEVHADRSPASRCGPQVNRLAGSKRGHGQDVIYDLGGVVQARRRLASDNSPQALITETGDSFGCGLGADKRGANLIDFQPVLAGAVPR